MMLEIVDAMRKASEEVDKEIAYSKADSLLVEALMFLSMESEYGEEIDEMLEYYRKIEKW